MFYALAQFDQNAAAATNAAGNAAQGGNQQNGLSG
jgi:hypothetical protein